MSEKELLKAERRAVREELARREFHPHGATMGESLVSPPQDIVYARLKELSKEQLEEHEKRLTRDIQDLDISRAEQLYNPDPPLDGDTLGNS